MSVHTTDDGRHYVKYGKGTIPDDPNRTREYFGRGPEAERKAIRRNIELGFGHKATSGALFIDVARQYLASRRNKIEDKSISTAFMHLETHLVPFFGETPATAITDAMLDEYVQGRATSKWRSAGGRGKLVTGVTRSTIRRELATFQSAMNYAAKKGLIQYNPVQFYDMPKEDDAVIAEPTQVEIEAILKVSPPHLQRFIILAFYTAVRPGYSELLKMKWEQVDFAGNTLFVISARKGGLRERRIAIHPALMSHLDEWHTQDSAMKPMPIYIVHYKGRHIKKVDKAWKNAKIKAKVLRRLRTYDIRHASITGMLEAGADLKAVSLTAGHSTPAMTMRRYQHASNSLKRKAINSLVTLGNFKEDEE